MKILFFSIQKWIQSRRVATVPTFIIFSTELLEVVLLFILLRDVLNIIRNPEGGWIPFQRAAIWGKEEKAATLTNPKWVCALCTQGEFLRGQTTRVIFCPYKGLKITFVWCRHFALHIFKPSCSSDTNFTSHLFLLFLRLHNLCMNESFLFCLPIRHSQTAVLLCTEQLYLGWVREAKTVVKPQQNKYKEACLRGIELLINIGNTSHAKSYYKSNLWDLWCPNRKY